MSAMSERRVPRTLVPMIWVNSSIESRVLVASSLATPDVFSERAWTSPATTLKAAPATPARAASIRALRASILVLALISLISSIAAASISARSWTNFAMSLALLACRWGPASDEPGLAPVAGRTSELLDADELGGLGASAGMAAIQRVART